MVANRKNRWKPETKRAMKGLILWLGVALACLDGAVAQSLTRAEALAVAESFVNHRWTATDANTRHSRDSSGVLVETPDRESGQGNPPEDCWIPGENEGVAYKWGGFDTPESFDKGVKAGKAAGDVYTAEKRAQGGAAVSGDAVGIDCSGFISRCWKLPKKHSTSMLMGICEPLASPDLLKPADVMDIGEGHVLLFVRWLDDARTRALFYEAAPFSKTRATERAIADMTAAGYKPLRYRNIHD